MSTLSFASVSLAGSQRPRLHQIDLELPHAECAFLIGPNGAGKSSILRLALGLERPSSGQVLLGGRSVSELTPSERAAELAWLPQQLSFEQALSAVEVVAAARYRFREAHARARARAHEWLHEVQAAALAERRVTQMSGGELQRVKLAALLAQETPRLLLDEPANHLDPAHQIEVYRLLGGASSRGLGILCVTHDINLLGLLPDPERIRLLGVRAGELRFDTTYADPELAERLTDLYGVPFERIERGTCGWFVPRTEPGSDEAKSP